MVRMERGELHSGFWWGNLVERDHLENLGVDDRVILKCILKKWNGDVEWTYVTQDRDK